MVGKEEAWGTAMGVGVGVGGCSQLRQGIYQSICIVKGIASAWHSDYFIGRCILWRAERMLGIYQCIQIPRFMGVSFI